MKKLPWGDMPVGKIGEAYDKHYFDAVPFGEAIEETLAIAGLPRFPGPRLKI